MFTRLVALASLCLVLFVCPDARCEDPEPDSTTAVDTLLFDGTGMLEQVSPVTSDIDFETRLYQRPTTALFKSMFVPGWGQLGNKRHVKAILFAGLDAWFISAAIHYGGQASDFRDEFESAVDIETRNEYYDLYLDRKGQRNKFTWFAGIVTFISMFDAFVDAHLSGYPRKIDESDLSLDLRPTDNGGFQASVAFNF